MKICSLLPSATEIVYALGLDRHLVAVTHECDFPPGARCLPRVTTSIVDSDRLSSRDIDVAIRAALANLSTIYELDRELLARLQPDIILTQELCEVCAVSFDRVQAAARELVPDADVVSLEPNTIGDILATIRQVADLCGVPERGSRVVDRLQSRVERVRNTAQVATSQPRALALEWLDPPFIGGHWVPEMIALAGGVDVLGKPGQASRQATWDEIAAARPEVVVLMPCGFGLERTVSEFLGADLPASWSSLAAVEGGRTYAVDGSSYFNRPGPRIVDGLEIVAGILHPEIFGAPSQAHALQVDR